MPSWYCRLFLGLNPAWRNKKFTFLGVEWSYERAVQFKGYECFLEAGFQTLLQTYVQMRTGWQEMSAFNIYFKQGYLLDNGGND